MFRSPRRMQRLSDDMTFANSALLVLTLMYMQASVSLKIEYKTTFPLLFIIAVYLELNVIGHNSDFDTF